MVTSGSAHFTERRQTPRYRIALRVELEGGAGETRDVSTAGAYFETDQALAPGAPIRLALEFAGGTRVQCEGQVVRIESREGKLGIAVSFTSYRFEEHEPSPRVG